MFLRLVFYPSGGCVLSGLSDRATCAKISTTWVELYRTPGRNPQEDQKRTSKRVICSGTWFFYLGLGVAVLGLVEHGLLWNSTVYHVCFSLKMATRRIVSRLPWCSNHLNPLSHLNIFIFMFGVSPTSIGPIPFSSMFSSFLCLVWDLRLLWFPEGTE